MRQCAILVGGLGTRLGTITQSTPKPIIKINDAPFLDYILEKVIELDIPEVLLLASYLSEQFIERYQNKKINNTKVEIHVEDKPNGTGGALWDAWQSLDDQFMLLNGDSIISGNYKKIIDFHERNQHPMTMGVVKIEDHREYGSVMFKNDKIISFKEKNNNAAKSALINAGIYIINKHYIKDIIKTENCSLEKEVFPILCEKGQIGGLVMDGSFIDIGTVQRLNEISNDAGNYITPLKFFV